MLKGIVARVIFVIHDFYERVVEKYVFDVNELPVLPDDMVEVMLPDLIGNVVDIDEDLRAAMLKLARVCKAELEPLPEDCSYTVAVELKEMAEMPPGVRFSFHTHQ